MRLSGPAAAGGALRGMVGSGVGVVWCAVVKGL